jgi:sulfonate transport system permease protein
MSPLPRVPDAPTARPGLGILLVLVGWEVAARALTGAFVLAAPSEVALYLVENRGLMLRALGTTLGNAAAGFLRKPRSPASCRNCLGMAAKPAPCHERRPSRLLPAAFVATGPILRVFFGPGKWPQIALAALAVYYTTLIPLLVGLRAAPAELVRLGAQLWTGAGFGAGSRAC